MKSGFLLLPSPKYFLFPFCAFKNLSVDSQVPPLLERYILQDVFALLTPRRQGQRRETVLTVIGGLIVAPEQPEGNTTHTLFETGGKHRRLSFAKTL